MIKEKFDLNNKVAVITGSSKGIGKAMAQGLAEFGATVIVSSRKQEASERKHVYTHVHTEAKLTAAY